MTNQTHARQPEANLSQAATSRIITPEQQYAELEAELALLGNPEAAENMRDAEGRWIGPYIRFNRLMREDQPDVILPDGRHSRYTSFAAAFPSNQPHTLILEVDLEELTRIQLSDKGEYYGVGHLTNGMTLDAIGRRSAAVMMTAISHENWRRHGTITNRREKNATGPNGSGKSALLSFYPNVRMPAPNERGRARYVIRNYYAIERDREMGKIKELQ